jgi:hypothetical protein
LLGRVSACALEEVNSSFNFGSALLRLQIRCFTLSPLGQSFWAVNIHETTDTLLPLSHHVSPPQALPPINRIHKYGPLTGDRPRRSLQVIVMRLKSLC